MTKGSDLDIAIDNPDIFDIVCSYARNNILFSGNNCFGTTTGIIKNVPITAQSSADAINNPAMCPILFISPQKIKNTIEVYLIGHRDLEKLRTDLKKMISGMRDRESLMVATSLQQRLAKAPNMKELYCFFRDQEKRSMFNDSFLYNSIVQQLLQLSIIQEATEMLDNNNLSYLQKVENWDSYLRFNEDDITPETREKLNLIRGSYEGLDESSLAENALEYDNSVFMNELCNILHNEAISNEEKIELLNEHMLFKKEMLSENPQILSTCVKLIDDFTQEMGKTAVDIEGHLMAEESKYNPGTI